MIFKIKNLSDNQADCFIIILEHKDRKISILVDGNREGMKSCQMLHEEISKLEQLDYIVVSHIDNDHLGGILKYLESGIGKEKLSQTKIIYNYVTEKNISFNQAKRFEKIIKGRCVMKSYMEHYESDDFLYFLSKNERKICPDIDSSARAFFTFLSPTKEEANKVWENLKQGKNSQGELINENSIVFMLEMENKRAIFTGDANWDFIEARLKEIFEDAEYKVDFIKIPHHGAGHNNVGLKSYAEQHECKKFLLTGNMVQQNYSNENVSCFNTQGEEIEL